MKVIWDTLVDRLSLIRRHEWCNNEVDVAEQEEDDDWERGAEWWCPAWAVVRSWVKVKVNQSTGNKDVDNGQWIGDDVEDKVEGISWWWRQHDDNGDNPVFEKTDKWGVEWLVGSPETRPWKNTLTTDLLNQTTLGEDDGEDVSEGGERDEDRKSSLSLWSEHVAEERGSKNTSRRQDLLAWNSCEVCNVGQHVKDGDGTEGSWSGNLQSLDWVLGLGKSVVGVGVSNVRPNDVVESGDNSVCGSGSSSKGIGEVIWLLNAWLKVASKGSESGADDQEKNQKLDNAQEVLKTETPVHGECVNQESNCDTGESDTTLVPAVDLDTGGVQNILSEDDGVGAGPTEEDDVGCVHGRDEVLWLAEDVLEVVLLSSVTWEPCAELHVDGKASCRNDHAGNPDEESQSDGAALRKDRGRSGEDTGSDHAVEDEESSRDAANMATVITGDIDFANF